MELLYTITADFLTIQEQKSGMKKGEVKVGDEPCAIPII